MITAGDLARWLAVDLKTVHNWVRRGALMGRLTDGRHRRFFRVEVVRCLRQLQRPIPEQLVGMRKAVGRIQLTHILGADHQGAVAGKAAQAALHVLLDAADGCYEALVVDLGDLDPAAWAPVVEGLTGHPLTAPVAAIGIALDEQQRQLFMDAGGYVAVSNPREIPIVLEWLTGRRDASSVEASVRYLFGHTARPRGVRPQDSLGRGSVTSRPRASTR